jgi:hypothetical protein
MVSFMIPWAVELSVVRGVAGWGNPMSSSLVRVIVLLPSDMEDNIENNEDNYEGDVGQWNGQNVNDIVGHHTQGNWTLAHGDGSLFWSRTLGLSVILLLVGCPF